MLHYMGTRQPPRKYVVAEADTSTLSHNQSCSICRSRVWTPESFRAINDAPIEQESIPVHYQITSEELRKSVLGGCEFCKTLADGIHGKVFLDELYQRLQESDSSSGTNASDDVESCSENANKEPDDLEHEWADASAFNEEEFDNDITGGWDVWEERDILIEACHFQVEVSFERGHAGLFTFVNAYIEAVDKVEHPNSLQKLQGEKSLELRYHVNTKDNRSNTSSIFPPWIADGMLGAETNMKTLEEWMHSLQPIAQSATATLNYLPSRLIQLCDEGGLRIVKTSAIEGHEPKFAALSYVWGTNQTFILLSTTEEMLTTGFGTEQLPKTIEDAVTVTRCIGIKYIWVDALCIMQDSDEDKAQELPKMRSIYKYATVTIVASVAKFATEGFLHHVEEKYDYFIEPVTIPFSANMAQATCSEIVLSYPADYKRWKDPINSRAWTFQELILSTRAILFSYRGVSTIDRSSPGSADGMTSGKDPQLPSLPWSGKLFSLATTAENTRQVWLAIRGEYSRRSLSYQGDKLVAVSAIAEELGQTYNSRYLAGMWERDLAIDLQWNCPRNETVGSDGHNRRPRAPGYVAPSWSWASVSGAVEDFVQVWEDEGNNGGIGYKNGFGFEVVSCEVELAVPGFEYGAVISGILVARGRICTLSWHPHTNDEQHRLLESDGYLAGLADGDRSGLVNTSASAKCGEGMLDAVDPDMHGGVEVVCLGGRLVENVPGREDVEGMMLLATTEGQYRRVGFFRVQTGAFEKGESAVVRIV